MAWDKSYLSLTWASLMYVLAVNKLVLCFYLVYNCYYYIFVTIISFFYYISLYTVLLFSNGKMKEEVARGEKRSKSVSYLSSFS